MSLDDTERAAYESLDTDSAAVWRVWIVGDLDAAERLDALDDEQRTLTMTALGLEPSPRPAQQAGQLAVTSRRGTPQGDSGGEKLIKRHQSRLDQNPTAATQFPPMRSNPAARSRAQPTAGRPRRQSTAGSNTAVLVAWALIVIGIASVAIAQIFGRDSVEVGFGISLTAQEPWAQPLTWGGAALAVIGLALLVTRNRTGSSRAD